MSAIGDNLRGLLARRGLSRAEFAYLVDSDPATVGRWIKGERDPSAEMLLKIAHAFGVTVDEILRPPGLGVKEDGPKYTTRPQLAEWFIQLRVTWQRDPTTRARIELGIRTAFPAAAKDIIAWLEKKE